MENNMLTSTTNLNTSDASINNNQTHSTESSNVIAESNSTTTGEGSSQLLVVDQQIHSKIFVAIRKAAKAEWLAEMKRREAYFAHCCLNAKIGAPKMEYKHISERRDQCTREMLQVMQQSSLLNRLINIYNQVPLPAEYHDPSSSFITVDHLPVFQWRGCIRDPTKHVFTSVAACLQSFEKAMRKYSLDLDNDWYRLLPMCLNEDQKMWLNEYLAFSSFDGAPLWTDFVWAFRKRFEISEVSGAVDQENATKELFNIRKEPSETFNHFMERFNNLKERSKPIKPEMLTMLFRNALPTELNNRLVQSIEGASPAKQSNYEFICNLTRHLDTHVIDDEDDMPIEPVKRKLPVDSESQQPAKLMRTRRDFTYKASSHASPNRSSSVKHEKDEPLKYCSVHNTNSHDTEECYIILNMRHPKTRNPNLG